jgi:ERCC4-type nuclease
VKGVISASSSELQAVYGIGNNVADKIKWVVDEKVSAYGTRKRECQSANLGSTL